MKKIRLCFLDIDDTLTSLKTVLALGGYPWPNIIQSSGAYGMELSRYLDPEKPVRNPEFFDPITIKLTNRLCEVTDTKIVLSSTWRQGLSAKECQTLLAAIGFNPELVIGRTDQNGPKRGYEIRVFMQCLTDAPGLLSKARFLLPEYADEAGYEIDSYVILDDSGDMLEEQDKNFVHVDGREGLTLQDFKTAGCMLTKDNSFNVYKLSHKKTAHESATILLAGEAPDDAHASHGQSS